MEPGVVEIASCSNTLTPEKAVTQEVIGDMQNGGVLDNKNKGKKCISYDDAVSTSDYYDTTDNIDSYPGSSPLSNGLLDPDSLIYEDDYDQYGYDMEDEDEEEEEEDTTPDEYSMYQDLFDSKDIPTGVEVSMEWFPDKEAAKSSGSSSKSSEKGSGNHASTPPVAQPWSALPHNSEGVIPSSAYALPQTSSHYSPSPFTVGPSTSKKWKLSINDLEPQTPDSVMGDDAPAPASSGLLLPPKPKKAPGSYGSHFVSSRPGVEEVISAAGSSRVKRNMEDYLGTYLFFKRFDIVEDISDHHYASKGTTSKQHSKGWARRIQEEWKILENDLPEMIFVRAYESRMDLLRAVIIGAEGTPYHDGLFFFDIFFPDTYPSVPPIVHYHSGGLRINPNLYNCGKVCLSLLGTWTGSQKEKWIPNDSTMLQVLVSIQGLILNQKPYFNEPGYAGSAGSASGEARSKAYSESTFLLSLKTMVYNMRRPPKHFEDFSYGHFFSCAHDVLKACDAYRKGAPVGSLAKTAVQESSQNSSLEFRKSVANIVETLLLKEFILLGVCGLEAEAEEEEMPTETNVAESSKTSSKRDRS